MYDYFVGVIVIISNSSLVIIPLIKPRYSVVIFLPVILFIIFIVNNFVLTQSCGLNVLRLRVRVVNDSSYIDIIHRDRIHFV